MGTLFPQHQPNANSVVPPAFCSTQITWSTFWSGGKDAGVLCCLIFYFQMLYSLQNLSVHWVLSLSLSLMLTTSAYWIKMTTPPSPRFEVIIHRSASRSFLCACVHTRKDWKPHYWCNRMNSCMKTLLCGVFMKWRVHQENSAIWWGRPFYK